jgi:glycosyltransferase involved in cell wall biosynthesis
MNDTGLTISVAMATYNGEVFLRSQLESIAAQQRRPEEIVIGDDGSNDCTLAIIDEFTKRTGLRVRVQRNQERLGSSRNFERILLRCTGDIIVLTDQDDIWRPDKLQMIEAAFLANPGAPYVFSNGSIIDETGHYIAGSLWDGALFSKRERTLFRAGYGSKILLRHNVVTGAALALRRNTLAIALPIGAGWIHDYWLAQVLESLGRGVILDELLVCYRRHATQQIGLFKRSVSYAIATIRRQDETFCKKEAMNFLALAKRFKKIGAPPYLIDGAREKAMFLERRARMRRHPRSAATEIFQSWQAGDYRRFTPGCKFIFLDVVTALLLLLFGRVKSDQQF